MSNVNINVNQLKGNLGANPESAKTAQGKEYAKVALFYQPIPLHGKKEARADQLKPVIFYLRFYDELAQKVLHELKTGTFLDITAGKLRLARNEENGELIFLVKVFDYKVLSTEDKKRQASNG